MSCLPGTLTQFVLVLYGTASTSAGFSTPDSIQLPEDGCKTYDLSQICTGKSFTAEVRVPPAAQQLYVQCSELIVLYCAVCIPCPNTW